MQLYQLLLLATIPFCGICFLVFEQFVALWDWLGTFGAPWIIQLLAFFFLGANAAGLIALLSVLSIAAIGFLIAFTVELAVKLANKIEKDVEDVAKPKQAE
jgi:hypothetical protein